MSVTSAVGAGMKRPLEDEGPEAGEGTCAGAGTGDEAEPNLYDALNCSLTRLVNAMESATSTLKETAAAADPEQVVEQCAVDAAESCDLAMKHVRMVAGVVKAWSDIPVVKSYKSPGVYAQVKRCETLAESGFGPLDAVSGHLK